VLGSPLVYLCVHRSFTSPAPIAADHCIVSESAWPHCSFAEAKLPGDGQRPSHFVKSYPHPFTQISTLRDQQKNPANPTKPRDLEPPKIKIPPAMQQ